MKAIYQDLIRDKKELIKAGKYKVSRFDAGYHYHPEYEITYIIESTGKRFVGDSISEFGPGDFVFIGPSIPHAWVNPEEYSDTSKKASAIVIQFNQKLFPPHLKEATELSQIYTLLENSKKGIFFNKKQERVYELLFKMCSADSSKRYIMLIELLYELSCVKNHIILNNFPKGSKMNTDARFEKLIEFIHLNYNQDISLYKAAGYTGMNKAALCRYLRKRYHLSYSELLNKVRIENACLLLRETNMEISKVAFDCGYSNLSYFCTVFKAFHGCSPGGYRKSFEKTPANLNQ